jgi:hypothetical protein
LRGHLHDHVGRFFEHDGARGIVDFAEPVREHHVALGEFLDRLRNLVQSRCQRFDVLALERGDERVDELLADLREQVLLAPSRNAKSSSERAETGAFSIAISARVLCRAASALASRRP